MSFVGSTPVARHVHGTASAAGKRIQALGGAKNHAVVLPDADLDLAADQITAAAYGSAGQRCMAISVAVAVGDAADPLIDRLAGRARAIKVGPGVIKSGGENVSMAEIERVLGQHPGIQAACIVRIAHPTWGEVPIGNAPGRAVRALFWTLRPAKHRAWPRRAARPRRFCGGCR